MERLLRRVIALKPDHHHAYNALGYSLADRNQRLPEARDADPEGARTVARRSVHHRQPGLGRIPHGQPRRGAAAAAPGLSPRGPTPRSPRIWARCCGSAGQRDEARRIWREARGRDAANEVLHETLARLQRRSVRLRRAAAAALLARGAVVAGCASRDAAAAAGDSLSRPAERARRAPTPAPRSVSAAFELRGDADARRAGADHAARHHAGAGALAARRRACSPTPTASERFADLDALAARGARRERCRWRRCSTGCAAGPGPARRASRWPTASRFRAARLAASAWRAAPKAGSMRAPRRRRRRCDARAPRARTRAAQ